MTELNNPKKQMIDIIGHHIFCRKTNSFFREFWISILGINILGLIFSGMYLLLTPNQYEARAQIKMAQITTNNNILGLNIEDPSTLVVRMQLPSSYDKNVISVCGFEGKSDPADALSKKLKLTPMKVAQIVEIKIAAVSPSQATSCLESIFSLIKESQRSLAEPILTEAKVKLEKYSQRLRDIQSSISVIEKSSTLMLSSAYMINKDEAKFLNEEVIRLMELISSIENRPTKLIAPIYTSENKISPKILIAFIYGYVVSLLLGLFIFLIKRKFAVYRNA